MARSDIIEVASTPLSGELVRGRRCGGLVEPTLIKTTSACKVRDHNRISQRQRAIPS